MIAPQTLVVSVATAALAFSMGLQPSMSTLTSPSPSPPPSPHGTQHTPAGASAHRDAEQEAVKVAHHATRKYRSLSVAERDGYALFTDMNGIKCIDMPGMGGMGVHYVNGDNVATPSVHLRHPEAVVYQRVGSRLRLVALEYVVLKSDWESVHGAGAPRPKLFGHRFDFTDAGNRYGLPPFYSLHAWIWKHNPDGRFAMWNPRVHCNCCGHGHGDCGPAGH